MGRKNENFLAASSLKICSLVSLSVHFVDCGSSRSLPPRIPLDCLNQSLKHDTVLQTTAKQSMFVVHSKISRNINGWCNMRMRFPRINAMFEIVFFCEGESCIILWVYPISPLPSLGLRWCQCSHLELVSFEADNLGKGAHPTSPIYDYVYDSCAVMKALNTLFHDPFHRELQTWMKRIEVWNVVLLSAMINPHESFWYAFSDLLAPPTESWFWFGRNHFLWNYQGLL